jgi:hypothetical protein
MKRLLITAALLALPLTARAQVPAPIPWATLHLGTDASVNGPALNGNVLTTCAATGLGFAVDDSSAVALQVVLDDSVGATTPTIFPLTAAGLTIFPLPFVGRIRIEGPAGSPVELRCF